MRDSGFAALRGYLGERAAPLLAGAGGAAMFWLVGWLYALPAEPLWYATLLAAALALGLLAFDFARYRALCRAVDALAGADGPVAPARLDALARRHLPAGADAPGLLAAWVRLLGRLNGGYAAALDDARAAADDAGDWTTLWVHQIKTPIAAARLLLQSGEAPPRLRAELEAEVFKIEQYVEMSLSRTRLSEGSDLLLEPVALDEVIHAAARKLAQLFVPARVSLCCSDGGGVAVTDRKWLGFILEQVLTNAVKYTPPGGKVTVAAGAGAITVTDTGIGIPPEDLPRIFEKGYTGYNGRAGCKSTGLGLYLCGVAAKKLGCTLRAESPVENGRGTRLVLTLPAPDVRYE